MPPVTMMIKPASGLCNMRCRYCFYTDVKSHRQIADYGIMTEETLEKLVRRAFFHADGSLTLAFQGGEPTLAGKPFFRKLLTLEKKYNARHLNVNNSIQTNGLVLDEEWMEIFREGHFLVGVSLDGTQAIHDEHRLDAAGNATWDRIHENLQLLKKSEIDYNILCVVNSLIASRPKEVFETLEEHQYLQFIPCLDGLDGEKSPWSLDPIDYGNFLIETFDLYEHGIRFGHPVSIRNFDNWLSMLNGYPPENCAMTGRCGNYFLIESDGSVYPCDFYVLDQWKMGNILTSTLATMESSETVKRFLQESLPVPEKCRSCPWFALCRNGCKRDREPLCGGASVTRLCEGHRMFFEARFKRLQALAGIFDEA